MTCGRFTILAIMIGMVTIGIALTGCQTGPPPDINPTISQAAKAKEGAPVAASVEVASLPYDPNLPTFVVAIEPLDFSASGEISGGGQEMPAGSMSGTGTTVATLSPDGHTVTVTGSSSAGPNIGKGISAQLMTALSHWGNIAIVEYSNIKKGPDGTYTCKLQKGEVGPFVIKGTITEFNETAEAATKSRGGSLGRVGLATGVIGAIAGNRDVAAVGAGVAIANPTAGKQEMKRSGMVGMDLQVIDGRSARIKSSYNCSGTFTTVSTVSGMSVFGIGGSDTQFAASALGQATRVAMNDALKKTADTLKTVR